MFEDGNVNFFTLTSSSCSYLICPFISTAVFPDGVDMTEPFRKIQS